MGFKIRIGKNVLTVPANTPGNKTLREMVAEDMKAILFRPATFTGRGLEQLARA